MSKRNANGKKQKLDRGESLATMKKVLHYLAAYRVLFVLSLLLAAVVVVLTLYLPILTGRAIDLLVGQGEVDPDGRLPGILLTAGIVILVTAVCQWLMNIVNNHITFGVVRRLRQDAFTRTVEETSFAPEPEEGEIVITKQKHFYMRPMTREEAVLQMELLNHSFFAFRDQDNGGSFAIVYKRNDGGYGLIDDAQ